MDYNRDGFADAAQNLRLNARDVAIASQRLGSGLVSGGLGEPSHLNPADAWVRFIQHYTNEIDARVVDVELLTKLAQSVADALDGLDNQVAG